MPSLDPIFPASNRLNFGVSNREFPEFLKTLPTFISSPFQSGVIAKKNTKEGELGGQVGFDVYH